MNTYLSLKAMLCQYIDYWLCQQASFVVPGDQLERKMLNNIIPIVIDK